MLYVVCVCTYVYFYRLGIKRGISGKTNKFTIDARDAGDGGLGFSVEGPSKAELNCIPKEDGTCQVEFLPKEPGAYTIHIKYADQHIPGSPFACLVADADGKLPAEPLPKATVAPANISRREFTVESSVFVPRDRAPPAQRPHGLEVDLTGYDISQLSANVETPTGKVEDAEIVKTTREKYTITFVTRNGGTHKVNVWYHRKHIPGSPFLVDVDTAHWQLTSKCKVSGPKQQTGVVGKPCVYVLSTKESGGGDLGVTVEGPTSADISCEPIGRDEYRISFVPMATGTYVMHMRFADQDIFKSVVLVPADDKPGAPEDKPSATELSNTNVKVGEKFTLQISFDGSADQLTAYVITPAGSKIPATVTRIDKDTCGVTFTPEEPGEYIIHVLIAGRPFAGSPYKLIVGAHQLDPSKVHVHGPGLKSATVGKETSFSVDAIDAGPGTLSIDAAGPAKLDVRCEQTNVGSYRVSYTPKVSGTYEMNITFGGQDVPNSPFSIEVAPDPDTSNAYLCTSGGTGLYGGVQGKQNPFTVNCSKAGRGSLLVGVEGPTIPVNEINVRHDGNNVFLVDYSLEEPGNYILRVLWGEEHIQGSPFPVRVERADGGGIYVGR